MSALPPLPNPTTPLAWLPKEIGAQLQASGYLFVATLGVWGWDFLMSTQEEYLVLFTHTLTLPQAAYMIARVFSLAYIVTATVFQMYAHNRPVVYAFALLWVATLGGCITAPFSLKGTHIGTTQRCIDSEVKAYGSAGIVISAVNDTLIFLAITYRLLFHNIVSERWSSRLRSFVRGDGMGKASKLMLKTGQLYYLVTAGMNILTVISILAPSFPPVLHAMFTVPNIALTNAMACRVYRQLRLGLLMDKPTTQQSEQSAPIRLLPTSSSRYTRSDAHHRDIESAITSDTCSDKAAIVSVHIQRETEVHVGDSTRESSPPLKPAGLGPL